MRRRLLLILTAFLISHPLAAGELLPVGKSEYTFPNPPDPQRPLRVFAYRPKTHGAEDPILIVLHGMRRNAKTYREAWIDIAKKRNILVLCPAFSEAMYPGSMRYNLGGIYSSSLISQPEIRDMRGLVQALRVPASEMSPPMRTLYRSLPKSLRQRFRRPVADSVLAKDAASDILKGLNAVVRERGFYDPQIHTHPPQAAQRILGRYTDLAKAPYGLIWEFNRALIDQTLGRRIQPGRRERILRSKWVFAVIEALFEDAKTRADSRVEHYSLFGHSAGGQLAHRHLMQWPEARVKTVVAANAGRYLWPDMAIMYPYGLRHSGTSAEDLKAAFAKRLTIMVGQEDADPEAQHLNRSAAAMAQGAHRLARARNFFRAARQAAGEDTFHWILREVPGVGHDNEAMAPHAASVFLEDDSKEPTRSGGGAAKEEDESLH